MSTSPLLKLASQKLWERRRAHYFAVFRLALMLLRERSSLPEGELDLNREYRFAVSTACRRLDPLGQFGRPVFEAQSPPDPDAETMQPHEWKRPDAQWLHDDPAAPDERHCEKSFFVEFKRLGSPTPTRRDLNEEYISHGVERFRSLEHRYGMHMSEGLMIAYLQSMGLQAVYAEVCRHAVAMKFPPLVLAASGWQPKGVTELFHHFERDFPLISPFGLRHFWVDIQAIPIQDIPTSATVPAVSDRQLSLLNIDLDPPLRDDPVRPTCSQSASLRAESGRRAGAVRKRRS